MPFTLADMQAMLLAGCQAQVNIALADPTTGAAPSSPAVLAWLNWPIGSAVLDCGGSVSSHSAVADGDLTTVTGSLDTRLAATALLAVKRQLRGSLALIDMTQGQDGQKRSQLAAQLDREIADLQAVFYKRFNVNPSSPRLAPMTSAVDPGAGGLRPTILPPPPEWFFP